tara:strand:+ start:321 stop:800 length:480 start_codon:yes stop_codon:yes gene_type:complete
MELEQYEKRFGNAAYEAIYELNLTKLLMQFENKAARKKGVNKRIKDYFKTKQNNTYEKYFIAENYLRERHGLKESIIHTANKRQLRISLKHLLRYFGVYYLKLNLTEIGYLEEKINHSNVYYSTKVAQNALDMGERIMGNTMKDIYNDLIEFVNNYHSE